MIEIGTNLAEVLSSAIFWIAIAVIAWAAFRD